MSETGSPYVIVNNTAELDHNNQHQPADDPKPGPSTTAAEFDLEVFDSGSSCSLEDCWKCDKDPPQVQGMILYLPNLHLVLGVYFFWVGINVHEVNDYES